MKTTWWIASALALLAGGCTWNRSGADGSGTIECTEVQVAPLVGGRLLELPPREGMALRKGERAARLDPADFELKAAESRAALAQAEAQLALLQAGSRAEDIQRAREQLREAAAAATAAAADLQRIRPVFEKHSATQKQLDDAQALAERAAAARDGAEQNLNRLVKGSRPEELRIAQTAVDFARVRVAQAEKVVADCVVFAPMDGVVTARIREEGEIVGAGAPLLTVARLDEVWLSIYVPEDRLAAVKLGQPARVKVDGDAAFYAGTVTFVSPEAEFTPRNVQTADERVKLVYRVKITLPNPKGVFKPGMPAEGYLGAAPAAAKS